MKTINPISARNFDAMTVDGVILDQQEIVDRQQAAEKKARALEAQLGDLKPARPESDPDPISARYAYVDMEAHGRRLEYMLSRLPELKAEQARAKAQAALASAAAPTVKPAVSTPATLKVQPQAAHTPPAMTWGAWAKLTATEQCIQMKKGFTPPEEVRPITPTDSCRAANAARK